MTVYATLDRQEARLDFALDSGLSYWPITVVRFEL